MVKRYEVRGAWVMVDLRRAFAAIRERGDVDLSLVLMPDKRRFAYTLFLAAVSTHEPGPLPEDELVG